MTGTIGRIPAFVGALVVACACLAAQAQPAEGSLLGNTYRNERLGWEMPVPAGWRLIPEAEVQRLEEKGREVIESSTSSKIDSRQSQLLYLEKDKLNRFTSTAQQYDPKRDGPYRNTQETLFKTLLDAYRSQGIPVEMRRRKESIGGLEFEAMHLTFLTRNRTDVLFEQIVYDRLINDRSLLISIMFNNEADRRAVYGALKRSTFTPAKPSAK